MELAYSNVIDWVLNDASVTAEVALQTLPHECQSLVMDTLIEGEAYKLSFGFSDTDGVYVADFTPRRGHRLALQYEQWMTIGGSAYDAIYHAKLLWEYRRDHPEPYGSTPTHGNPDH
jgi:hypothetical protein